MSPFDVMFWALAGVVTVALAVAIVAGVVHAFIPKKPGRHARPAHAGRRRWLS